MKTPLLLSTLALSLAAPAHAVDGKAVAQRWAAISIDGKDLLCEDGFPARVDRISLVEQIEKSGAASQRAPIFCLRYSADGGIKPQAWTGHTYIASGSGEVYESPAGTKPAKFRFFNPQAEEGLAKAFIANAAKQPAVAVKGRKSVKPAAAQAKDESGSITHEAPPINCSDIRPKAQTADIIDNCVLPPVKDTLTINVAIKHMMKSDPDLGGMIREKAMEIKGEAAKLDALRNELAAKVAVWAEPFLRDDKKELPADVHERIAKPQLTRIWCAKRPSTGGAASAGTAVGDSAQAHVRAVAKGANMDSRGKASKGAVSAGAAPAGDALAAQCGDPKNIISPDPETGLHIAAPPSPTSPASIAAGGAAGAAAGAAAGGKKGFVDLLKDNSGYIGAAAGAAAAIGLAIAMGGGPLGIFLFAAAGGAGGWWAAGKFFGS